MASNCMHKFVRFRLWPVKQRFRCVLCGLETRLYDGADRNALRPVHPHMCVAFSEYNIIKDPKFHEPKEVDRG